MIYKTYGELRQKVERETDTEAEDFVGAEELMGYFQDAVNEAEAHIHKLGLEDDYFLSSKFFDLSLGQTQIVLPTDIYANKIRNFYFIQDQIIFPVIRLKGKDKFMKADQLRLEQGTTNYYSYIIFNSSSDAKPIIELYPAARHNGSNLLKMIYIRNAIEIVSDDSPIDIPEFYSFIIAYVKWKIYDKEGSPKLDEVKADMEREKTLMIETLEQMVPDDDNIIPLDTTHYEEAT